MRLWVARIFGTAGTQMLMVALGWHMYELTHSAWNLGLVGLYQFVPALLLALLAGHVVDRHHRGRILAACFWVQGAVALAPATTITPPSAGPPITAAWLPAALNAIARASMPVGTSIGSSACWAGI